MAPKRRLIAGTINHYPSEDGWENVHLDASPRKLYDLEREELVDPDIVADIADLGVIDDESFDEVRCWQTLEHLTRDRAELALFEFFRVLRPGGVLDLEVPDLEKICRWYANGRIDIDEFCQSVYGQQGLEATDDYALQLHRFGYSPVSLRTLIVAAGFTSLERLGDSEASPLRYRAVRP